MGINMELQNKNDYEFIDFSGLDENIEREIKEILRSRIASEILKLPWGNCERDYISNSVPETSEAANHWQRYGLDDGIESPEVTETAASIMTSPMSGNIAYSGSYLHLPYPDWSALGGNAYSNTAPADPNAYSYVTSIAYAPSMYQPPAEVINASPNRDHDRRNSRGRNRKHDPYRILNSNDIQPGYLVPQGQFNQIPPMCHPGVPYISYAVAPQQHPAAGRPIFIPSPQPYTQPQIHTHHNNHPQYSQPSYSISSSGTSKQHSRQSSGQNYSSQEASKNVPHVYPKVYERALRDGHITAQSSLCQLPNINDYELSQRSKPTITKCSNFTSNNWEVGHTIKKQTANKKVPLLDKEIRSDNSKTVDDSNDAAASDQALKILSVSHDVDPSQGGTCSSKEPEILVQSMIAESTSVPLKVNGEDTRNGKLQYQPSLEVPALRRKNISPRGLCKSLSPPLPYTLPSSAAERTFASILKKKNMDIAPSVVYKSPVARPGLTEAEVSNDTSNTQHRGTSKFHTTVGPLTSENDAARKTLIGEPFQDCKKRSTNLVQGLSCDPASYRIGEFLLNYQMEKQTVSLLPRGLTNRSNYCYINSILQAILACPPFYNLLRALSYSKLSSKNSSTPLINNMVKFVNEFVPLSEAARLPRKDLRAQKKSDDTATDIQAGIAFEPSYVYTMLKNASCASVFSIEGRQEDAEEFLSCLLNGINDEMLELMKQVSDDPHAPVVEDSNVNYSSGDEEWKVMGPRNKGSITRCTDFGRTPLSDIFRGQLRSRILRQGEQSTDNVQPFFTLQLDIEKAESVKSALEILVGKDQVEGMMCSKTKQQIKAWKQVTLEELPVVLILHLKWFDYKLDGCSKIFKSVTYAIDLKVDSKFLSPNVAKKLTAKQKQYKLFAVTYHDGKEATKGHYVTDAFHVGYGAWVRYDDSSVKGISENDVLNPTVPRVPYLLYYRRCDTIGNNQLNNPRTR